MLDLLLEFGLSSRWFRLLFMFYIPLCHFSKFLPRPALCCKRNVFLVVSNFLLLGLKYSEKFEKAIFWECAFVPKLANRIFLSSLYFAKVGTESTHRDFRSQIGLHYLFYLGQFGYGKHAPHDTNWSK